MLLGDILEKKGEKFEAHNLAEKKIGPNRNLGEVDNEKIFP
jgi:hypothetical protein